MSESLTELKRAAQGIRELVAEINSHSEAEKVMALSPYWMSRLDRTLRQGSAGIAGLADAKSSAEAQHYRQELIQLKHLLEESEPLLRNRKAKMSGEQARLKNLQSWANTARILG